MKEQVLIDLCQLAWLNGVIINQMTVPKGYEAFLTKGGVNHTEFKYKSDFGMAPIVKVAK